MKVLKQIEVVAFCALTSVLFAEKVAPYGESVGVDVAAGSSATETGPVMVDPSSRGIEKTGGGTYVLPLSAMASRDGFKAQVREGKLTLADTGAEGVSVAAPECLQNAALWLDAGQNTVVEDGVVTKWLDVREGATDNNAYYCAGGGSSPGTASDGGKTWINFGGYGSGKWLSLQNAARSALSLTSVFHAYAVLSVSEHPGMVFGVASGSVTFHHCGMTSYWNPTEGGPALYAGKTYLDGVWIDGTTTGVKSGAQLIEWEAGNETANIGNFFNDRNINDRKGGAMMGEVVLFTNRLDSVDRMKVEEYLMQKWLGKGRPNSYAFKTAAGTEIELDGLADEEFAKVSVAGLGAAEKKGAGTVTWRDTGRNPGVPWHIAQGSMAFESGDIPLSFESGDTLAAATDDYGVTTFTRSSGAAGTVSSLGGGAARISALPNDTTSFTFSGAALSFAAPATEAPGAVAAGGEIYAAIPNAGFEAWNSQQTGLSGTKNSWTFSAESGIDFQIFRNGGSNWKAYINGWYAPEGQNVLAVKAKNTANATGTASVQISIPAVGRYEFTCKTFARSFTQSCVPIEFSLAKNGTSVRVARIQSAYASGYQFQSFTTQELEAGEYTFTISVSNFNTSERWAYIDDLKLRLVRDPSDETVFPVPNGDFEVATMTANAFSAANTAEGWTFSNPTGGDPDVGLAWRGTVGTIRTGVISTNRFNAASATLGNIQLAFFGAAGTATSGAFTLPAGKWMLRLRAGRWGQNSGSYAWNGKKASINPTIAATATVNGDAISLGSFSSLANNIFKALTFPTVIESDGTASVSLRLSQTASNPDYVAGLLVDDLEFVRVDNLVENGNFEEVSGSNSDGGTNGGWLLAFNRGNGSNVAKAELVDPSNAEAWGRTRCEGTYALHIVDCGAASRSITFPESGLYRISFRARGRASYASGGDTPDMTYAGNRVKALLDGVEIYRSPAIGTTNFVAYSGMFRIAEAGTKTFAIQGCAASGDKNAFVDLLSIEKAAVADVPDIPKTAEINVRLADGEKLRLDYPGTLNLKSLCVNGKNLSREISAETRPDFISGPGSVYVVPNGLIITFR